MTNGGPPRSRDHGSILPIVLVVVVIISVVVVALADYASTTLRYGQVVERSADRLATVKGATENALEDLARGTSACTQTALSGNSGGYTYTLGDTINGIAPQINCEVIGDSINVVDAFAVIMTGAGGQTGPLLTITNGGNSVNAEKVFDGPVYIAEPPTATGPDPTLSFNATLTIQQGDLWYSSETCPSPGVQIPDQLTISPAGYGPKCRTEAWDVLFQGRRPPEPNVEDTGAFPDRSATAPAPDALGCRVWSPGRYSSPPELPNQSYNYFRSGDYYFDDIEHWDIQNAFVLFGYPGTTGPSIDGPDPQDTFANNPCRDAWNEPDKSGAALYMGGDSHIHIGAGTTFEVSGRMHGTYNVGLQALEDVGDDSDLGGNDRIVQTESGGNKQLSIQGLVWAPFAGFEFDLIANEAVAALTGGAVVAELAAGASANANNFVIGVDTQPATSQLQITATASNQGETRMRTILVYRTDRQYAVLSRRILNLTPE